MPRARCGCAGAQKVGRRGSNGADVKATDPYGRRWVIQCEHRKAGWQGSAVGTPDLQVLNGTGRQIHGGDVLVMLANGRFSRPALDFAKSQRLRLVDRRLLASLTRPALPPACLRPVVPSRKLGPARIGPILGLPASAVHRILARHGLDRLAWLDLAPGAGPTHAPGA
ncbi:Restriction endonuclease [Streptomyces sp. ADI95-16]|nr:Restriction endonuclease [Streptomyces sp. ADI95-16]